MANILKCKMCGGDIEVSEDMTVGKCLFCGSTMTLPRIDSDKKARLFNRANEYRLNNEFDKAYDAYKTIAEEDPQEAEAYWGMVLSEYGVEYVEDPKAGKRIPTCHRTRLQPITSSVDYKHAIQCADAERKFAYQDEAEQLNKIQKEIMAISSKEEPYSVFICYKETDDITGDRTKDSVLAQDIYDALEAKGIRTFFARISLEDKLGQNYEPFIFSALSSAKVMIHVTTSPENSEAVWVKNEWSRYMDFMSEDKSKALIPGYLEMSPYELPDQMQKLQAQDMSKVGAIQDLVRGIQKLLGDNQSQLGADQEVLQELVKERKEKEAELKRIEEAKRAQEEREKAEQERKEKEYQQRVEKNILFWKRNWPKFVVVFLGFAFGTIALIILIPKVKYNNACKKLEAGDYEAAYIAFEKLGNYKNSKNNKELAGKSAKEMMAMAGIKEISSYIEKKDLQKAIECYESLQSNAEIMSVVNNSKEIKEEQSEVGYQLACTILNNGEEEKSREIFENIGDYKDSKARLLQLDLINSLKMEDYQTVEKILANKELDDADKELLKIEVNDYLQSIYSEAESLLPDKTGYNRFIGAYQQLKNCCQDSPELSFSIGCAELVCGDWKKAIAYLSEAKEIDGYETKLNEAKYGYCKENREEETDGLVAEYLNDLAQINYKDSVHLKEIFNMQIVLIGTWEGQGGKIEISHSKANGMEYHYNYTEDFFMFRDDLTKKQYKGVLNGDVLTIEKISDGSGVFSSEPVKEGTYRKK